MRANKIFKIKMMMLLFGLMIVFIIINFRINKFEIVMLSVGQGDGIFIDSGMGERFFIDGGSTSNDMVGKYVMEPFLKSRGISHIDGWFISHMDLDHVSGFIELVENGFKVENLYLSKSVEEGDKLTEIMGLCKKFNIDINYMEPGDSLVCENGWPVSNMLELTCIAPDYPSEFSGANENSLVLWLRYGKRADLVKYRELGKESVLLDTEWQEINDSNSEEKLGNELIDLKIFDAIFTGDIGEDQEKFILEGNFGEMLSFLGELNEIEVLKSSHHGSNSSNCEEFLEILNPEVVIISAGKNNRYGHPGREAIGRMDDLEIDHYCTIDCGQITVKWVEGEVSVESFIEK